MVSHVKEIKTLKTDLLIVVSSYNGYGFVVKHLEFLARQTFQKFNLLFVLGLPFDVARLEAHIRRKKFKFGTIIAKENERRGCTGGFFTGQKYALENGYGYLVMGDDDCMPVDRRLVQELYRNRGKGYVAATMVFVEDGYRKKGILGAPTSYSLISTAILRKYGLYYLPLFHGADDAEFMERVKVKPLWISNNVEHPYIVGMRLFSMFDRAWFFLLQGIIIIRDMRTTLYNLALLSFMCSCALCFLPPYGRKLCFAIDRLLLTYTYGKKASDSLKSGYEGWIKPMSPSSLAGFFVVDETDPASIDRKGRAKFTSMAKQALSLFNRDVVIEKTYSFMLSFFISITARRVYVNAGKGKYLVFADNSNLLLHCARILLFPVFLAIQAMICILFIPIKIICQPRTQGYGLD